MRKNIIICAAGIMALCMTGCSIFPDGSLSMEKQEAKEVVIENNHAKGLLGDGVSIDADIIGADVSEWSEFTAGLRQFDDGEAEKISKVFMGENGILEGEFNNAEAKDGTSAYVYKNKINSGDSLTIATGKVSVSTSKKRQIGYSSFFEPNKLLTDEELRGNFPKELIDGLDRDAALDTFKDLCDSLELTISDNVAIYALDKDSANKIRQENDWISRDKNGDKTPDWVEADEAYFILTPVVLGDMELPSQDTSSNTGYSMPSYIYAVIGRDGLYDFCASGIYEVKEEKKVADIHQVQEVLDYLATNYSYLSGAEQNILFTEISLRYVTRYYSVDKEYKIVPTWVCTKETKVTASKDGEEYERTRTEYLYIDAQTMTSFSN